MKTGFRYTSLKLDAGLVAGNVVSLILAVSAYWYFSVSIDEWDAGSVIHVLMGTCVFIGGAIVGFSRQQPLAKDSLYVILLSPATFILSGLMLLPGTSNLFAPFKSTAILYGSYSIGMIIGLRIRTASIPTYNVFLKCLGSMLAGFVAGVVPAFLMIMITAGLGEGWMLIGPVIVCIPALIVGGLVTGFLLGRYVPIPSSNMQKIQLFVCSPALLVIIPIYLHAIWTSRDISSHFTFVFSFFVLIIAWFGSLLGWRLHAILSQRQHVASQSQAH